MSLVWQHGELGVRDPIGDGLPEKCRGDGVLAAGHRQSGDADRGEPVERVVGHPRVQLPVEPLQRLAERERQRLSTIWSTVPSWWARRVSIQTKERLQRSALTRGRLHHPAQGLADPAGVRIGPSSGADPHQSPHETQVAKCELLRGQASTGEAGHVRLPDARPRRIGAASSAMSAAVKRSGIASSCCRRR